MAIFDVIQFWKTALTYLNGYIFLQYFSQGFIHSKKDQPDRDYHRTLVRNQTSFASHAIIKSASHYHTIKLSRCTFTLHFPPCNLTNAASFSTDRGLILPHERVFQTCHKFIQQLHRIVIELSNSGRIHEVARSASDNISINPNISMNIIPVLSHPFACIFCPGSYVKLVKRCSDTI